MAMPLPPGKYNLYSTFNEAEATLTAAGYKREGDTPWCWYSPCGLVDARISTIRTLCETRYCIVYRA